MAHCEFCKNEHDRKQACPYCGTPLFSVVGDVIYGATEREVVPAELTLTDRFLILRRVTAGETMGTAAAGAAFGMIGVLVASAAEGARKKLYAYYDLREVQKFIYPYHTAVLKKDVAVKLVNRDGTDMVFKFPPRAAKQFVERLQSISVYVENGVGTQYTACCMAPFVDAKSYALRVCHAAGAFVRIEGEQFVAPPIESTYTDAAWAATPSVTEPAPVPPAPCEEVPCAAVVEEVPPVSAPPAPAVDAAAWAAAWGAPAVQTTPVQATPVAETVPVPVPVQTAPVPATPRPTPPQTMCSTCGWMNAAAARFCCKCGTPLTASTTTVADWTSQW